jgi:enoyl-CoA hydratase
MSDIVIRIEGRAGRITLNRPKALNALTYPMVTAIATALDGWRDDPRVGLVLIDAEGERAFCAGGDIAEMYRTGTAGDHAYGRRFWRDEYAMNFALARYPKPVITLMQGFTMGGGVGVGCLARHRIVGESARIAMPECGIGLVPDVGGSRLLARAPAGIGRYLGATGARMGPGDAIVAGFADAFVPQADWPALTAALVASGAAGTLDDFLRPAPESPLGRDAPAIGWAFAPATVAGILARLDRLEGEWIAQARTGLARGSPLSIHCALEMQRRLGPDASLADALALEYRFTHRAMAQGDFLEGIRATIIDKDNAPRWRHRGAVPEAEVAAMLAPLGDHELRFTEETT